VQREIKGVLNSQGTKVRLVFTGAELTINSATHTQRGGRSGALAVCSAPQPQSGVDS